MSGEKPLEEMSFPELKAVAAEEGIKGIGKEEDVIEAIKAKRMISGMEKSRGESVKRVKEQEVENKRKAQNQEMVNDATKLSPVASAVESANPAPEPAPVQKQYSRSDSRSPMNYATDEVEVDGMKFTRRKRGILDMSGKKTVDIPEEVLNNNLQYRVVNDEPGRIEKMRQLGYEIVDSLGEGVPTSWHVGTKKDGSDLKAYLMATPKKWKQERDKAAEQERSRLEHGQIKGELDAQGNPVSQTEFYNAGSSITHG